MSVAKLSEELVKASQDITVLTTTANGKEELDVPIGKETLVDGVKVFYFKRLTKDHTHFSPALLKFLHRTLKSEKQKDKVIVHIHAWWNLVSIFSCLIAKLHGVKVVLSPRGMLTSYSLNNRNSKFKDAIHFFLGKSLLRYCHIHATSAKEQQDVKQTCEVNGISIIPNFVNFPKITPTKDISKSEDPATYKLLFLSRIEEKKGLELLFEALTKVTAPWQLAIAGTGELNYIQTLHTLAEKMNIQQQIQWLGHVENEYKFDLIAKYDLLILTSYNENFANVVVESLAMGTPVLLSKEVGLADYVIKNDLGWVVRLNSEEIANALISSFDNVSKRTAIRSEARKNINENFNEKKLIEEYNSMYIKISNHEFL